MNSNNIKQLIQNLRRGDNIDESKTSFFIEISRNVNYWCETLTLRWLVSVVDTYADYGTNMQRSNAMIISTYFNMVKISDTSRLLTTPFRNMLPILLNDVVFMYDEVNSLKITSDDMPNILFYRINEQLKSTPTLLVLFEEIKTRLAKYSQTLSTITPYHKGFYDKIFFEGRRNFLSDIKTK